MVRLRSEGLSPVEKDVNGKLKRNLSTLRQSELCDAIRSEAGIAGILWRGLTSSELIECLRQERDLRKEN